MVTLFNGPRFLFFGSKISLVKVALDKKKTNGTKTKMKENGKLLFSVYNLLAVSLEPKSTVQMLA